jgi:ribosome-binding protein aMBF1 (putative translation factor)
MSLQIIKSVDGKDEYVLLPVAIYHALREQITSRVSRLKVKHQLVSFEPEDYIENPVALARMKAGLTQEELAQRMQVSQAYISKIETQEHLTAKILQKVKLAIEGRSIKPKRDRNSRRRP